MSITNPYIISKLALARPRIYKSEFSLDNFVGKNIEEHRKIDYKIFRKPNDGDLDDPHYVYEYPPRYLLAIIFNDGTFLATEQRGNGEQSILCSFYFDGSKTLFSDHLFR